VSSIFWSLATTSSALQGLPDDVDPDLLAQLLDGVAGIL